MSNLAQDNILNFLFYNNTNYKMYRDSASGKLTSYCKCCELKLTYSDDYVEKNWLKVKVSLHYHVVKCKGIDPEEDAT